MLASRHSSRFIATHALPSAPMAPTAGHARQNASNTTSASNSRLHPHAEPRPLSALQARRPFLRPTQLGPIAHNNNQQKELIPQLAAQPPLQPPPRQAAGAAGPHQRLPRAQQLLRPGAVTRIATFNTSTLANPGEAELLARDLEAAGIHMCGLQEVRLRGSGDRQLGTDGAG